MLLSLPSLVAQAQRLYQDGASLRERDAEREAILTNQHQLPIPESMRSRSMLIYSSKGAEKVDLARTLLTDPKGPRITVAQQGTGVITERSRDRVQEWLTGSFTAIETQFVDCLFSQVICEDNLVKSRAGAWVLPNPMAWSSCPYAEDGVAADNASAEPQDARYGRARSLPDVMDVANQQARENERRAKQSSQRDKQAWFAQHFPIRVRVVNPTNLYIYVDDEGLCEVVEIAEMPVRQVLTDYLDEHGEPMAQQLAQDANYFSWEAPDYPSCTLTDADVCTLVTRADREHYQVFITNINVGGYIGQRWTRRQHGSDELVCEREHGLTRVPFAYFPGRTRNHREPSLRFNGFLDPAMSSIYALDTIRAQLASSVWQTAWPNTVMVQDYRGDQGAPGAGDHIPDTSVAEGSIWRLPPGADIKPFNQISPEAYRLLDMAMTKIEQQIDLVTISKATYGASGADNGYLQAQLAAAGGLNLEPFEAGQSYGYSDMASLLLECGAHVLEETGEDEIPVRFTSEEGTRLVTLNRDLADQFWVVEVSVKAKPIGGEMALVQTLTAEKAQGWESDEGAMQRLGIRNISRKQAQVTHDRILSGTGLQQAIEQAAIGQIQAALARMKAPPMPQNPILPAAALGAGWQSPEVTARLPQNIGAQGGIGGLPNMGAQSMAPPAPTPTEAMQRNAMGVPRMGPPVGQGQAQPGGTQRLMAGMGG